MQSQANNIDSQLVLPLKWRNKFLEKWRRYMSDLTENTIEQVENIESEATFKKNESKADKFIRLGEYRINKTIKAIEQLENLSNKSAYEYTPEQVENMFSVIEAKIAEVKAKFMVTKQKESTAFSFNRKIE